MLKPITNFYLQSVIPRVGGLIGGDAYAYRYLPESTRQFQKPEALQGAMQAAGLENVSFHRLMFGTVVILHGTKPVGTSHGAV